MKSEYLEGLKKEIKEYFHILVEEIPEFLIEYIQTPAMQRIGKIGIYCGTDYTNIFHNTFFYSNLEHSIGVALIIWHFTKDKKQTLAGLFHDIATPAFKHCIDFLHGDYGTQESTEELTTQIIKESKEIMELLQRDGIFVEEIDDYKRYPIADNHTPKLSADRLEYTFANGMSFYPIWNLEEIRQMYEQVTILENEEGLPELGFTQIQAAEKFIADASKIWPQWISSADKLTMQFFADIMKRMIQKGYMTEQELYVLSEQEVIERILRHSDENTSIAFKKFQQATQVKEGEIKPEKGYCVSITAKKRYIIPLVKTKEGNKRIDTISEVSKQQIQNYLSLQFPTYAYLDFDIEGE